MTSSLQGDLAPHVPASFSLAVAVLGRGAAANAAVLDAVARLTESPPPAEAVAPRLLAETRQQARAALCASTAADPERRTRALTPLRPRPGKPAAVVAALCALPDDQRVLMHLVYFGCYTYEEIAALTEMPLADVRRLITTAARALVAAQAADRS